MNAIKTLLTAFLTAILVLLSTLVILPMMASGSARTLFQREGVVGARNVILFIGDGMGPGHVTAGRFVWKGVTGRLSMEMLPIRGASMTYPLNALQGYAVNEPDTASGTTALATGQKVPSAGYISILPDGTTLETILEQAQRRGLSTGLVTTFLVAGASPGAFASHVLPGSGAGQAIALQVFEHDIDVVLGGGEQDWIPQTVTGCYGTGFRSDGRNLKEESGARGGVICTAQELRDYHINDYHAHSQQVLGLFARGIMPRPYSPTLAEMADLAIRMLSRDPDGFFLVVHEIGTDSAAHQGDIAGVLDSMKSLDDAVQVGLDFAAGREDTLIVVTADHDTGAVGFFGNQDFLIFGGQHMSIGLALTGHTAVDVPVFAGGPLSERLTGVMENTYIHDVMLAALLLGP